MQTEKGTTPAPARRFWENFVRSNEVSKPQPITGTSFLIHVCKQLNIDSSIVRRIVIDTSIDCATLVYIERLGTEGLLEVDMPSGRVIKGVDDE